LVDNSPLIYTVSIPRKLTKPFTDINTKKKSMVLLIWLCCCKD